MAVFFKEVGQFHSYVRPVGQPVLTEFCTQLTGITQPMVGTTPYFSVVDPKLFFSDPDPTFQEILDLDPDPDPISDPTSFISKEAIFYA